VGEGGVTGGVVDVGGESDFGTIGGRSWRRAGIEELVGSV
jgi:hypothetical protein